MLLNYLKTAYRNLVKSAGFSIINVIGLAIGVACCVLIMLFVFDELSYDRHHEKADRIYRIGLQAVLNNNDFHGVVACAPLAAALVADFPEVEASVRFRNYGFPVFRYRDKVFSEERVIVADSSFFDVFTVRFLQGDAKSALRLPNSAVITESMADKYFGEEDPMGKVLNSDNRTDYVVTAVVEDVPRNSHFHFDFLHSLATRGDAQNPIWLSNNFYTYLVLKEGASPEEFEDKLYGYVVRHIDPQVRQFIGIGAEEWIASGGEYRYFLQPLRSIHLRSHLDFELEANGHIAYVYIFSTVAVGILLVACINFINLSTARSSSRAREVGIRKTVGSVRGQLIGQFLAETIFMSAIAVLVALLIVTLLLPSFNLLSGKFIALSDLFTLPNVGLFLLLALFIGVVAGAYPAFFLASFHPVSVMKGERMAGGRQAVMRSVLVVVQFAISVILIIATFVVRNQLNYIQNQDLGFEKENIILVHKTDDIGRQIDAFKQELLGYPGILSVANSNNVMGYNFGNNVYKLPGATGEESHMIWVLNTDEGFSETYGIEMAGGHYFQRGRPADDSGIVLNEAAVQVLGLEDPVGRELATIDESQRWKIIGVMRDFHYESLHQKIRPLIVYPFGEEGFGRYLSVRVRPEDVQETLAFMEETWRKFALEQAFEYEFFEDHFARIYLAEERTARIFLAFTALAIVIASLGLFGLAAFIAEQRTKEIGIRKAMGATVSGIIVLLTKQFTKWVLVANVIAWPAAYYAMNRWLQNFAYREPLTVWVFAFSAGLALLIAVLTVSYQSVRAAVANPVDSLRYE